MGQSPIEVREPKAEARERFHNKLRAFLAAGWELIEAWDDDGFNADVEYPLPAKITPPMSLDEWFSELSAHYETNEQARAEMAQADLDLSSEEDEVHDRIIAPPDNTAYRVVLSDEARADAERGPRATAKARRADCPDHRIDPMDNNWCRLCDTGECPDCSEPTYYDEAEGWYRHFDPTAGCFLVPPHAAE